jgi:hypothetical protein
MLVRFRTDESNAHGSEGGTTGVSAGPVLMVSDRTWDAIPVVLSCTTLEGKSQSASTRFL